jgi:tRNA threonylcarbamoyladenosine biosynthesis protein TsaB
MKILAIDTSGEVCSLCLTEDFHLRSEYSFRHERHLTERLPSIVTFLLNDAGVMLADVDVFAVGLGPGSFTGVRVGVTMAKVWAETFQKRIVGVSSLDTLARAAGGTASGVVAVAPSRKNELIAAFYPANKPRAVREPELIAPADVPKRARELLGDVPVVVVGECAKEVPASLTLKPRYVSPRALWVAQLADARLRVYGADDPATLTPLYIAPTPVG